VRIRTKLLALVLLVAGGFLADTALSIRTYEEIASMRGAIDRGVRLIAGARRAHGLMTDLVFDLFSPRLYSSLQGIILAPTSLSTQRDWKLSVDQFRASYAEFMSDPVLRGLLSDEELKSAYDVADRLSERAFEEFDGLEADFSLLKEKYKGSEELYSRLQLSKDESRYAVFDHVRSASFYLGNIFESYLERFVGVLELSAERAQRRAILFYALVSAIVTAAAFAGVLVVTRSILANVRLVDKAVERMSEGDFSLRVAPSGHDELGSLAERVNLFAERLKANVDSFTDMLGEVNTALPEAPDLDRILAIVIDAILREEGAEGGAICLVESGTVARSTWSGFSPVSSWELLLASCAEPPRALLIRDASASAEAVAHGLDPSVRSALALPLVAGSGLEGLCVFARRERPFTDLEIAQLGSFADYAAQVVDNAIVNAALRARSDAEYRALQAQVQPHFIYNVLNGFVALNRMGETRALEASLHALRDMMRYTLEHGREASVAEEFDFLERYCRLQKLRFEDRFSYEFDLDPEAAGLHIPKLLVQPLLENALIHGIEPSARPCTARVSGRIERGGEARDRDSLVLEVSDDGVGCGPSSIDEKRRVGIGNVRERLSLLYAAASLELEGRPGEGFAARISIPLAELETSNEGPHR
jgi:sensor histidine kinase YesM